MSMLRFSLGEYPLDDEEKASLKRSGYGAGHQVFELCPLCGKSQWICSDSNRPEGVSAHVADVPCQRCNEVRSRAPEVVDWVLSVLGFQEAVKAKAAAKT